MTKVIFMGTPKISVKVLEAICSFNNVQLLMVVSQPDKQTDRKKAIVYSPVKKYCLDNQITIIQPNKIIDAYDEIKNTHPDIVITCAYGQFVPQKILDLPTIGCFNLHASLLPKLRGGAPIHWSIINGDCVTGVTLMKMVLQMDAGDIISQKECLIEQNETTKSLTLKLADLAAEVLKDNWTNLVMQKYASVPQDSRAATFGYNISKQDMVVDFNKSCQQIDCLIRGLYDKPIAVWQYKDMAIKIHEAHPTNIVSNLPPGTISKVDKTGVYVATSDFDLQITKLQLPNKNVVAIHELINGHHPFKS